MKLYLAFISVLAMASSGIARSWFFKPAYGKWHEAELERWLADNNIPYPTPTDRKGLEDIVSKSWNRYIVASYEEWDIEHLNAYLDLKGITNKQNAETHKDTLVSQARNGWYESEDKAQEAWASVKDWILNTWTDAQLKAFINRHGILIPHPEDRDDLLQQARENYRCLCDKAGNTIAYPGNWLYETWTDSDLEEWLNSYGFPIPQPTNRDNLISGVRRNSRIAYLAMQDQAAASVRVVYRDISNSVLDAWSENSMREFAGENGIKIPRGTNINEVRALIRKTRDDVVGDSAGDRAVSKYGGAATKAGNKYTKTTDSAPLVSYIGAVQGAFNTAVDTWSESRLQAYLDAHDIPVPYGSEFNDIRALVRKNHHLTTNAWTAWTFDDFSIENPRNSLVSIGDESAKGLGEKTNTTRDDLISTAQPTYSSVSSTGENKYASVAPYFFQQTATSRTHPFDN